MELATRKIEMFARDEDFHRSIEKLEDWLDMMINLYTPRTKMVQYEQHFFTLHRRIERLMYHDV